MKLKSIIPVLILALTTACGQSGNSNDSTDDDSTDLNTDNGTATTSTNKVVVSDWPPSEALIATDLIGRSLTEEFGNKYHDSDWCFTIEEGNISDLKISEVLTHTDSKYLVLVDMKLSNGGNYYYQTKAKINYIRSSENDAPVLDYVTSLGMTIVSDGEFDDDIEHSISGSFLVLNNKCDISLTVGGKRLMNSTWENFSVIVPAHSSEQMIATDYRIEFIIRDY